LGIGVAPLIKSGYNPESTIHSFWMSTRNGI
jgi:hypothetical protein